MKAMMDVKERPAVEVVPFEAMNRMPPLERLTEQRAEIVPGMMNVWYEYVPASYDASVAVPLVIQLHGGGQDGRRWASQTAWHALADKHGFIVVYPNSPVYGLWRCNDEDIQYLCDLIEHLTGCYSIDRTRVYMQGMSNGDMMTLAFTMKHPELLAAAAFMTGPSPEAALEGERPVGPLPILQMRGELDVNFGLTPETEDVYANRYHMNDLNRELWMPVNGAEDVLPSLSIQGKDNFLCWPGKHAPIIDWEVQGMGHREPPCGAQVTWDKLYSGCARHGDRCIVSKPHTPIAQDDDTVLLSLGSAMAWRGNQRIPLAALSGGVVRVMLPAQVPHFCPVPLGEMAETEVLCAPAEMFVSLYGADMTIEDAGETARLILRDGRHVTLRSQSVLVEIDGSYQALQKPCLLLGGVLYVPAAELCQMLFDAHVSVADDVLCISGHYAVLGRYTASIIRRLIGGQMRPRRRPS